ncbi:polyphosphate kinase 1 [Maribacter sp. 2-571]|uniref:polyphosphate kinase 1 n=1 Tax=Maribacter sp. 2-571 TaxID=3417569 RepID=UPI003D350A62
MENVTNTKKNKDLYKNRDLDWINFNGRVLQEAADNSNPLYERLKFLAIFSSNLDEFFKVRVSKLRQIRKVKKAIRKPLALKPNKLLKEILKNVQEQQEFFGRLFYTELLPEMHREGITLLLPETFDAAADAKSFAFFEEHLAAQLSVTYDTDIETDTFEDGQLYLTLSFSESDTLGFLKIPTADFPRFITLSHTETQVTYAFLEDVIKRHVHTLFPDKKIVGKHIIKISRDAALYLDDDYDGEWVQQIYESLAQRNDGQPTRLLFETGMPKKTQKRLRQLLALGKIDMVPGGKHHNFSAFFSFPRDGSKMDLSDAPMPPLLHPDFENGDPFFDLISDKDRIVHFPYQRFDYLESWLTQAATDKNVRTITISLYRVANDSQLTSALLTALTNKKEVNVFVEVQARFDERNNLKWGKIFEENGGHVHYSFRNVKVHSKILLIEREEAGIEKRYAYIGTGNFNAKTAKLYCDHGIFTADEKVTSDLQQVFAVLKREIEAPQLDTLIVSPFTTRTRFEALLQNEITNARQGKPAGVSIKMNSLEDKRMIDLLYKAGKAGVRIRLLVRGFCCLIPGVPGLSDNITVTSIVDRYLEHARVFLFHDNGNEKMFIGSADWMTRNLDKRIEVLTAILDDSVLRELKDILELQFKDNVKARKIDAKGTNTLKKPSPDNTAVRSQLAIYRYLKNRLTP